jgi:acetyltransferase-like isoleucine patch superfamily enzyme
LYSFSSSESSFFSFLVSSFSFASAFAFLIDSVLLVDAFQKTFPRWNSSYSIFPCANSHFESFILILCSSHSFAQNILGADDVVNKEVQTAFITRVEAFEKDSDALDFTKNIIKLNNLNAVIPSDVMVSYYTDPKNKEAQSWRYYCAFHIGTFHTGQQNNSNDGSNGEMLRWQRIQMTTQLGLDMATLIHPDALVTGLNSRYSTVTIGAGTYIHPGALLNLHDIKIGNHCSIGANTMISHHSHIGNNV